MTYFADSLWQDSVHQMDSHCWYGSIPTPGDLQIWKISNAITRRKKFWKMLLPYYVEDGGWRVPLWNIAGIYTHSSVVPNLWLAQRPWLGL